MTGEGAFEREEAFHDAWAQGTDLESIRVREAFESFTALENRHCLELMGPLEGRRVLDLGAGLGETSVYFALQGARVTAVDISPQMVLRASQLAAHHDVVPLRLHDPASDSLPNVGLLAVFDPETGERRVVDSSREQVREDYAARVRTHRERMTSAFRRLELEPVEISTPDDYVPPLLAFFRRRAATG